MDVGGVKLDKKTVIIGVVLLVAAIILWDVFGGIDNRGRADRVTDDLRSAGQHNNAAISELDRAQKTARDLEAANKQLAETSNRLSEANDRLNELAEQDWQRIAANQERINRGKQILQGVRERGEKGN